VKRASKRRARRHPRALYAAALGSPSPAARGHPGNGPIEREEGTALRDATRFSPDPPGAGATRRDGHCALGTHAIETVLNLAAGLDTRPYRLNLRAALRWVEVDLPSIVRMKREALANETGNSHFAARSARPDRCSATRGVLFRPFGYSWANSRCYRASARLPWTKRASRRFRESSTRCPTRHTGLWKCPCPKDSSARAVVRERGSGALAPK
jgi:hypothetical protein